MPDCGHYTFRGRGSMESRFQRANLELNPELKLDV